MYFSTNSNDLFENNQPGNSHNQLFDSSSDRSVFSSNYSIEVDNGQNHSQLMIDDFNVQTKNTFPFGDCRICNDEASGVHYGVVTCEGCKVNFDF